MDDDDDGGGNGCGQTRDVEAAVRDAHSSSMRQFCNDGVLADKQPTFSFKLQ